ncbi:unnamed protein product [Pleuronectes platessa]|uniref:Uncharacterized protein n=1 Tax=Pleuronectes platessa TaxID=8262 RepID=A0A9N7YIB3_PLEPL|nr:unnamed protein product [Pleuronectes platessa]
MVELAAHNANFADSYRVVKSPWARLSALAACHQPVTCHGELNFQGGIVAMGRHSCCRCIGQTQTETGRLETPFPTLITRELLNDNVNIDHSAEKHWRTCAVSAEAEGRLQRGGMREEKDVTFLRSWEDLVLPEGIWCLGSSPPKPRCQAAKLRYLPKPRSHSF